MDREHLSIDLVRFIGQVRGVDSLGVGERDFTAGTIYLSRVLDQPIHPKDGVQTRYIDYVELSGELHLVNPDGQPLAGGGGIHLRGGGMYHQNVVQEGNRKMVFCGKIFRDERMGSSGIK